MGEAPAVPVRGTVRGTVGRTVGRIVGGTVRGWFGQLLFPGPCCLCRGALADPLASPVCEPCRTALRALEDPACPRCGLFFAPGVEPGLCGPCRAGPRPFRAAVSAAVYEGVFRNAVVALKFGRRERLAPLLAAPTLAAWRRARRESEFAALGPPPAAVVPVPLPFWRRRRRGFNQAETLGREIARGLGLPLVTGALRKRRRPPQTRVAPSARAANARGAFRARPLPESLAGKPLLLVDDVFTTGATVEAAVRSLRRAGAGPVDVLTVARSLAPPAAGRPRRR